MPKIWITGARGFIGRNLAKHLSEGGHLVVGLGHGAWPDGDAARWGVSHWVNGDVQPGNLRQLAQDYGAPDFVYHLAGGSSVGAATAGPLEDFARSVITTAEVLDWIRLESPETRVVAASSAAVYGAGHGGPISESLDGIPASPYGYHKLLMEHLCRSYASTYGVQVALPRMFSVYGAGLRKQLLWDVCTKLSSTSDEVQLGGSGDELRDWIDVRDLVKALDLVKEIASDKAPRINVGTGIGTPVRDVATLLVSAWPERATVSFDGRSRIGNPFSLLADTTELRALGFEWTIRVDAGIRDYVRWYLGPDRAAL
jgi:UDP-glucose 4-epimerase